MLLSSLEIPSDNLLIIAGVTVFCLFMAWRGWRLGVMRLFLGLAGLVAGYLLGQSGGTAVARLVPFGLLPEPIMAIGGGIVLAIMLYIAGRILGALIFKRTGQQEANLLRWAYGFLGALLGLVEAVALVWLMGIGLRISDSATSTTHRKPKQSEPALHALTRMLHDSGLGSVVEAIDPVPVHYYKLVVNSFKALSSPQVLGDFLSSEPAQQLAKHPKVVALRKDTSFERQIRTGNYLELFRNQRLIDVVTDKEIHKMLLDREVAEALEKAANRQS